MNSGPSILARVRFISSVSLIYGLTLLFAWVAFKPLIETHQNVVLARSIQKPVVPTSTGVSIVSGLPSRLVIPGSAIDLPIEPGYYDSASSSWTLSGYDAQFAMISTLSNSSAGDTFIYGHNNDFVFGALRHNIPLPGATALIYTTNGHIFDYAFSSSFSLAPDDSSILTYSGSPIMTIQTCTGSVNEWRTMYRFNFVKVIE